ncbi:MAG: hypothetical protein WDO70_00775 [Alphaproteobacteria bacterium]
MSRVSSFKLSAFLVPVCAAVLLLAACESHNIAQFWRPISQPNIMMPLDQAQIKLEYDLSQCSCGIYPRNIPRSVQSQIDLDKQRLNETGVSTSVEVRGECIRKPSLVVAECMRGRGWETTNCSGRVSVSGGAAVCATYEP